MTFGTRILLFGLLVCGLLAEGCSTEQPSVVDGDIVITISGQMPETRVTMTEGKTETSFGWEASDAIGLFVSDFQRNCKLACVDPEEGIFQGSMPRSEKVVPQALFAAYYPFSSKAGEDVTSLSGTLPSVQDAGNVMAYDYIVANLVVADYDEHNFPDLRLEFNTHLFALTKLSITASSDIFDGESLCSVGLKSTSDVMAGDFTFNATDPSADAVFSSSEFSTDKSIIVKFSEESRPTILHDNKYSVYAIINPGMYKAGTLSLEIVTSNYKISLPIEANLSILKNMETILSAGDICSPSAEVTKRKKDKRTIVLWGDSITQPSPFSSKLQQLLGANWTVVNGGVPSDPAYVVAARQGGYPLCTGEEFVLRKSASDTTQNDGLWVQYSRNGIDRKEQLLYVRSQEFKNSNALINPVFLTGYYVDDGGEERVEEVECSVDYEKTDGWVYFPYSKGIRSIHRVSDGDHDLTIKAGTPVSTYASRTYKNADVIVVYVGTNGNTKATEYYNHLVDAQKKMLGLLRKNNPDAVMIVCGYQMNPNVLPQYWTQEYVDTMTENFGKYFIDQRTEGAHNAVRYMKTLGQITDESEISEEDKAYIAGGNWPSAWGGQNGVHPNTYGYYVRALLVYDKMKELGYLDL